MGTRVTIGNEEYQVTDWSVQEESSPLSSGDSSGGVGSISLTLPLPDPALHPDDPMVLFGPGRMFDQEITLADEVRGSVTGAVDTITPSYPDGMVSISGPTRLSDLVVYNVQADPFVGTLSEAFAYYLSLAGITTGYETDASVASVAVVAPGFQGDLWAHLKLFASAYGCDISLVSGVVSLRPARARETDSYTDISNTESITVSSLAQTVEVYWYADAREITDELVYPPGGWTPDTEVLTVNYGETAEYQLDISQFASVSEIQDPTMLTDVGPEYTSSSVYTIVADDGLPISASQWTNSGGKVTVSLNPDTKSLTATLVGPSSPIYTINNEPSKAFSLALSSSDSSGSQYSTLRIVGTGVGYRRKLKTFRTGVSESQTSNEVGETLDNPFLTTLDLVFRSGTSLAASYSGVALSLSGTILEVDGSDPEIGNVQGSRKWDARSKRWYRVRSATISPSGISFDSADDDLTYGDLEDYWSGSTYGDVEASRAGETYRTDYLMGLRGA